MTRKRYPGKFEGCADQRLGEALFTSSLDGCNDELGDVDGFGWYGLIKTHKNTYIISTDSQGFFDYSTFSHTAGDKAWSRLADEYETYCDGANEEDYTYCSTDFMLDTEQFTENTQLGDWVELPV
jgi:hypothetical protein